jgi:putative FmdB family regulatory protein
MPIYEYRCSACDHLSEVLMGLNDPPPLFCPSCGAEGTMRKAFAPPTIHFRGSGWAKKDRSTTSRPSKAESGASDARSDGDSGSPGKSADKPTDGKSERSSAGSSDSSSGTASAATGSGSSSGDAS